MLMPQMNSESCYGELVPELRHQKIIDFVCFKYRFNWYQIKVISRYEK